MLSLCDLDDELLCCAFRSLSAHEMARVACARAGWGALVTRVAEEQLRLRRTQLPAGQGAWPCWLRSLAALQLLECLVGPMPTRTWRDEFPALRAEESRRSAQLNADDASQYFTDESDYMPGSVFALDSFLQEDYAKDAVQAKVAAGWAAADAVAFEATNESDLAFAPSLRERQDRFAATLHTRCGIASRLAGDAAVPQERLFGMIDGVDGLAHGDAAWAVGRMLECGVGGSFTTSCEISCVQGTQFRDEAGCSFFDHDTQSWQFWDSAIVAVRSSPPDSSGFHAPIFDPVTIQRRTRAYAVQNPVSWWVPALSRITIEEVHAPGEWQVRGLRVRQRLFVVSISFG